MNKVIGLILIAIFSFFILLSISFESIVMKSLFLLLLIECCYISKDIMFSHNLKKIIRKSNFVLIIRLSCGILFLIFLECLIKDVSGQDLNPSQILIWLMLSIISLGAILSTFMYKKINLKNF